MAINWLAALKAVPWGTILSQAPTVVDAANRLLSESKRKRAPPGTTNDLEMLKNRVAALEEHDQADAAVVKQLADQVAELARASQVVAARIRLVLLVAMVGIALGIVSLVLTLTY